MAGWYGFTFFQVSKLQSHQIAYMLVFDDFNARKGVTPGYKQPLPPFALEWYFFSKSIDKKEIKRDEAPLSMLVPVMIMTSGILLLGIFSKQIVETVIQYAVPGNF